MSKATQFRREADKRYNGRRHRSRYPQKLKSVALDHLSDVLGRGGHIKDAAQDLGVDANSLRTWLKAADVSPKRATGVLNRMRVVSDATVPRYVVHGPAEMRIECADAESVADLVRALR